MSCEWEAVLGTGGHRDFASLLDDLLVATDKPEEAAARPTIPFDYLAVADELHSGRIRVSRGEAAAEYCEAGADYESELASLLDAAQIAPGDDCPAGSEPLPPAEPEAIARELGLDGAAVADFGRLRRSFALKNHPDRVAPHLRERALARMQVANRLIDEARRQALAKAKR